MSDRWTPTLDDFVDLAAVVLDAPEEAIRRLPRLPLAESAIAAPFASFGGADAYPTLTEQAAVLITHLAQNHPLPDGNKRVSFLLMVRFLAANGAEWCAPDVEQDAGTVERIAAGTADRAEVMAWIERRTAE
jgi:death on curing protein